jgi:hypothetical protein
METTLAMSKAMDRDGWRIMIELGCSAWDGDDDDVKCGKLGFIYLDRFI